MFILQIYIFYFIDKISLYIKGAIQIAVVVIIIKIFYKSIKIN